MQLKHHQNDGWQN